MTSKGSAVLDQIFARGYASVRLESAGSELLDGLYAKASGFFAKSEGEKLRYGVENRITGYRPFSYANTGSADKPDLNDSFLYWKHRRDAQPNQGEIAGFLNAAEAYRAVAAEVVVDVIEELRAHYGYKPELPFEQASVLQINSFVKPVDREYYQFAHEDADLLTVIWASHPGLEGVFDEGERIEKYAFDGPGEVLIMPGSLLTAMTDNAIKPFYHQVRNYNTPDRKSIMYFVSPEATNPIEPFVAGEHTAEDIQRLVIENPQMHFGLSEDFVSA
ncbi:MAG TPA: 2OG-Fe(II) oxygenase family protein [Actinocrinis sp.]|nr:2OG-Fe(II) oxygenase family protein [Actinocrinis sp.]